MKVEKRQEIRCDKCGSLLKTIDESIYYCDYCKNLIERDKLITIRVFYKGIDDVREYHFCNWKHCFRWIINTFSDNKDFKFIDFGVEINDERINDFIKALKKESK